MAEQRLNANFLGASIIERACAISIIAVGVGAAILLAMWGIARMWHFVPPELSVRIANPELHLAGNSQVTVTQGKPFTIVQDKPFTVVQEPPKQDFSKLFPSTEKGGSATVTTTGEVIRREVTVFYNVAHSSGLVWTGWKYRDGHGGKPHRQYCNYLIPNFDRSSTQVYIAEDGVRLSNINASLVPDLEGALAKCQWWNSSKFID